ncbi:LOW QUALITY PROTEIN: hypothetical protein V1477_010124 [Vespula maculifrons]|uniref:BTB domain-containing protein n=1 Tax=Vespula maculifrons TaxID=7453 RepID=A0ABD2CCH2_VESMC
MEYYASIDVTNDLTSTSNLHHGMKMMFSASKNIFSNDDNGEETRAVKSECRLKLHDRSPVPFKALLASNVLSSHSGAYKYDSFRFTLAYFLIYMSNGHDKIG